MAEIEDTFPLDFDGDARGNYKQEGYYTIESVQASPTQFHFSLQCLFDA